MRLRWKVTVAVVTGALVATVLSWSCVLWSHSAATNLYFAPMPIPERVRVPLPSAWLDPPPPAVPFVAPKQDTFNFFGNETELRITYEEHVGFGASMVEVIVDRDPVSADVNRLYDDHTLRRISGGWPLRALEGTGSVDKQTSLNWTFHSMVVAPDWCQPGIMSEPIGYIRGKTYLPLHIVPLGFLCDTLLFAAPLLALMRVHRGYIRWRRKRKGLCPPCGYDRHGLAADAKCPECGTVPAPVVK